MAFVGRRIRAASLLSVALAALGAASTSPPALAHEVKTKDGKTYEGKVVSQDEEKVVIETTFDGTKEVPKSNVASVDTSTSPLRDQLASRVKDATDAASLVKVVDWARSVRFKADGPEIAEIWKKVVELDPKNARAHKALGHVLENGAWLTPEEKAKADAAAHDAAMRAKGLVPYDGKWVTPEEKDAREKGLVKDGDQWVTEEVFHKRRGEKQVDGKWVRVGEAEGKARAEALSKALGVPMVALWSPHIDLYHELEPTDGQAILDACEKVASAFYRLVEPGPEDKIDGLRIEVVIPHKMPTYTRYVDLWNTELKIAQYPGQEEWANSSKKMSSFWWPYPKAAIGAYLFPKTMNEVRSVVAHQVTHVLLACYRANYRFWLDWRAEGLAYYLEIREVGPSSSFNYKGGVPGGGDIQAWQDTKRWQDLLKALTISSLDTPMLRLFGATQDQLGIVDLAKSWSVVKYLIEAGAPKWKAFIDRMKKERDEPVDEAFKAVYGYDVRELDSKWRASLGPAAPPPGPPKGGKDPKKPPTGGKKTPP